MEVLGIQDNKGYIYEDFKDSISRENDGHYSVKLPRKKGNFYLPMNKQLYESRLKGQLKRMSKSPEDLKTYDTIIQLQFKEGIVEEVPGTLDGRHVPHHPVIRQDAETQKLRIV